MNRLPSTLSLLAAALGLIACSQPASAAAPGQEGTEAFDAAMKPILASYLVAQEALASDSLEGVSAAAKKIEKAAAKLDPKGVTGEHAAHFAKLPEKIGSAAGALAAAKEIATARDAFKKLSRPVAMWTEMTGPEGVSVVFCSMAKGSWVQSGAAIRNPYYGAKMLACGEVIAGAALEGKSHAEMSEPAKKK